LTQTCGFGSNFGHNSGEDRGRSLHIGRLPYNWFVLGCPRSVQRTFKFQICGSCQSLFCWVLLLILGDEIPSCRYHRLGLLRFSAAKSRDRIAKPGIKSKQVDGFLNALWLDRELEFRFRNTRLQSVLLMVLALDLLSRIASRYGRCGRKVFEANQNPILSAMEMFDCVPYPDADKMLAEPLRAWLKEPPEFDPEGWALPLFGKF